MAAKHKNAIDILTNWIEHYSDSPNTCRSYQREFDRLHAWLSGQKLTFASATQTHLERYLRAFSLGETISTRHGTKSVRTLSFTRDAVLRMFSELERGGIRGATPIRELNLPDVALNSAPQIRPSQTELDEWDALRKQWHDRAPLKTGSRDPLDRQFFVAEFIFCMALSSQELADGVMADFQALDGAWQLQIRQANVATNKYVLVPAPAMTMLKRYRESRGLSSYPDASETNVPIVARQRSERRVNAWAVAKCLDQLSKSTDQEAPTHRRRLSSRLLRRYLILRSLSMQVDERSLRKHVRSDYAVNVLSDNMTISSNGVISSLTM